MNSRRVPIRLAVSAAAQTQLVALLLLQLSLSAPVLAQGAHPRVALGQLVAGSHDKVHLRVMEEERGETLFNLAEHFRTRTGNKSCRSSNNGVIGEARHLLGLGVSSDGKLRNLTDDFVQLDRELLCNDTRLASSLCWLNFTAMYCGLLLEVAVEVADVNDWLPLFAVHEVTVDFSEADEPFTLKRLPLAIDRDGPGFSVKRYTLRKRNTSDPFCLVVGRRIAGQRCDSTVLWQANSSELSLALTSKLDRETRSEYHLQLLADDGPHLASINITVKVADVNDHTPKFLQQIYTISLQEVSESHADVSLLEVSASDADFGENAELSYSLEWALSDDVNNYIEISESGDIRARGVILDYERWSSFSFRVLAIDNKNGGLSRTGTAEVLVNLLDVNDNAPKIKVVAFGAETVNDQAVVPVVENMADRNFVAKIVASDDDSGDNGRITCEVDPESSAIRSAFHITRVEAGRNVEYQVATARAFDREQMSEYYFDVRCHDRGNPQLSASLRLTVRVTDTNDNAPKFGTSYYEFFVPEDTPAEKVVGVFDVSDADDGSNGNLHFWLDASVSNLFRMDAGRLVLAGRLDRELCENYTFAVHVSDQGDPPLTSNATVRLRVTDVNDHAPQINATLHVEVPENIPFDSLPHLIYTVRVHDVDAPGTPNSNVSFMLLEDGPFIIDKNGNLFLNALLDRETRASYQFQLLAHDNGQPALTSTCTVSITVTDANDVQPQFVYPLSNRTVVRAALPLDVPIATFEARDGDAPGENSRVRYALANPDDDLFMINDTTGQLFLIRRPASSGVVRNLRLTATDGGRPALSSTIVHTIELVGVPPAPVILDDDYAANAGGAVNNVRERTDTIYIICAIVIGISACLAIFIIILILIRSRRVQHTHVHDDEHTTKKRAAPRAHTAASKGGKRPQQSSQVVRNRPQSRPDNTVFSTADYRVPLDRVQSPKDPECDSLNQPDKLPHLPVVPTSPFTVEYDLENASRAAQMRAGLLLSQPTLMSGTHFAAPKMNTFCLECNACMQTLKMHPSSANRTDHYQFSRPSSSATVKRPNELAQLTFQPAADRQSASVMLRRLETAASNRYDAAESTRSDDSYASGGEWDGTKDADAEALASEGSVLDKTESIRLLNASGNAECNNNNVQRIVSGLTLNGTNDGNMINVHHRMRTKSSNNMGAQPIAVHEVTPFVFDLQPQVGTGPFETVAMPPNATLQSTGKPFKNLNFEHSFV